jgi:hypothetical protein
MPEQKIEKELRPDVWDAALFLTDIVHSNDAVAQHNQDELFGTDLFDFHL